MEEILEVIQLLYTDEEVDRRFVSRSGDWAWERCSLSRAVLGRMDTSSRSTGSCGTSC